MVSYFEGYEAFTNKTLDLGFAARMVMHFFHLLQRAALGDQVQRAQCRAICLHETVHSEGLVELHFGGFHPFLRGIIPSGRDV